MRRCLEMELVGGKAVVNRRGFNILECVPTHGHPYKARQIKSQGPGQLQRGREPEG